MAKKKKKQQQKQISDAAYLRSGRARKLPLHECFINVNWEQSGMATIITSRKHVNGNISVAVFLVDLYCLGVKDVLYRFNISNLEYQDIIEGFSGNSELERADYTKAHNIVYGAIAFAEDYGFSPHDDFKLAQMILEEDTEDVPLIEYAFGFDGKPRLVTSFDDPKLPFYLNTLDKHAGKGNYELIYMDYDDDYDDSEDGDGYVDNIEDDEEEYLSEIETYEANDWEDFILGTDPEDLLLLRNECFYIFEKAILNPAVEAKKGVGLENMVIKAKIAYDPLPNDNSEEEKATCYEIYEALFINEVNPKLVKGILDKIKSAMEKWPENASLHNYLINAYAILGKNKERKKAILAYFDKFPEYPFAKFANAELLMEEGKEYEVPAIFNNSFEIESAFPERELFHISEFVSFYMIICQYYMLIDDLCSAMMYRRLLDKVMLPEQRQGNEDFFFRLDLSVIMEVKALIEEVQQDEVKRKQLVAALAD